MKSSVKKAKTRLERMTRVELIAEVRSLRSAKKRRPSGPPNELQRALHELESHQVELEMQNRELRETQQLLEESRNRYADLFDFAPVGYVTIDNLGRIQEINLTGAAMLGVERSNLIGNLISSYMAPGAKDRFQQYILQCGRNAGKATTEVELEGHGGSTVLELLSVPSRRAGQNSPLYRTAMTDITERKRVEEALRESEEQLRHSQKMEAIGRLAGGIAHDFNNLLTAILGNCELSLGSLDRGEWPRKELGELRTAAECASALTSQLLTFSRKQVLQPRVLNLNALVANMNEMLRRLVGEDVELEMNLDPVGGDVKADPSQIEQIIMNLAVNARDAMPQGGKLVIRTASIELTKKHADKRDNIAPGSYVTLAVEDTGCGMSKETAAHIFEPFFTTKATGKGTGLGLATVYGIVRQMGGYVTVQSEEGKGTFFRIYMPRIKQLEKDVLQEDRQSYPVRGNETILLVEDEHFVRSITVGTLRQQGYRVLEASNGKEALSLARRHGPEKIHLLLTDVIMPEMGGRELVQQLLPLRADMKILYMSGYPDDAIGQHGVLDSDTDFLPKPFTPKVLQRKVREVLDK